MGPAILWLLRPPAVRLRRRGPAVPDSQACPPIIPDLVVTAQTAAITLVVFVAVVAFIYWVVTADLSGEGVNRALLRLAAIAGGAILGILVAIVVVPPVAIVDYSAFPAEPLALIVAVALAVPSRSSSRRRATPGGSSSGS